MLSSNIQRQAVTKQKSGSTKTQTYQKLKRMLTIISLTASSIGGILVEHTESDTWTYFWPPRTQDMINQLFSRHRSRRNITCKALAGFSLHQSAGRCTPNRTRFYLLLAFLVNITYSCFCVTIDFTFFTSHIISQSWKPAIFFPLKWT